MKGLVFLGYFSAQQEIFNYSRPYTKNPIQVQKLGVISWHLNGYIILMFCE